MASGTIENGIVVVEESISMTTNSSVSPFSVYGSQDISSDIPYGYIAVSANAKDANTANPTLCVIAGAALRAYGRTAATVTIQVLCVKG